MLSRTVKQLVEALPGFANVRGVEFEHDGRAELHDSDRWRSSFDRLHARSDATMGRLREALRSMVYLRLPPANATPSLLIVKRFGDARVAQPSRKH
jgi:hypothetical protein